MLTVTLDIGSGPWLAERLREANMSSIEIGLHGRYHHKTHSSVADALKQLCQQDEHFRLPTTDKLRFPLCSTADAQTIPTTSGLALHDIALDLILCKRAHWVQTLRNVIADLPQDSHFTFVPIGIQKSGVVPPSLTSTTPRSEPVPGVTGDSGQNDKNEIAIIGMAARFPESDSIADLWQLLVEGRIAFSPDIPPLRFDPLKVDGGSSSITRYHGNFLRDPDAFDHRFFGISGREAKTMDPQQRLALQVAYEALESAGYFSSTSPAVKEQEKVVGVYMGVGAVEYEENIASDAQKNAFSAVGMLRSFISGRISHFFGWNGPALTVDTACSSSAVAIHTACKVSPLSLSHTFLTSRTEKQNDADVKQKGLTRRRVRGGPGRWCQCHHQSVVTPESRGRILFGSQRPLQGVRCVIRRLLSRRGRGNPGAEAAGESCG